MAVDKTLIAGAGKAVKRGTGVVKSLYASKIAGTVFDAVKDITAEKIRLGKEFDKTINAYLEKGEYLDGTTLVDVMDTLSKDRKNYIWGSKKEKMLLKVKMEKLRSEYQNVHDELSIMGDGISHEATALDGDFKSTLTGQSIMDIYSGNNGAIKNPNPPEGSSDLDLEELGFMIMGENGEETWMTRDQIKDIVDSNSRDGFSGQMLDNELLIAQQFAISGGWDEYDKFDDTHFKSKVDSIIKNGNLTSLTNHQFMALDGSFLENLVEDIQLNTYSDWGIETDLTALDPTPGDNTITKDDAEMIAKYFTGQIESPIDEREVIIENDVEVVNENFGKPLFEYNEKGHRNAISRMYQSHIKRAWQTVLPADESWKYDWYYNLGLTEQQIEAEILLRGGRTAEENKKYAKYGPTGKPTS